MDERRPPREDRPRGRLHADACQKPCAGVERSACLASYGRAVPRYVPRTLRNQTCVAQEALQPRDAQGRQGRRRLRLRAPAHPRQLRARSREDRPHISRRRHIGIQRRGASRRRAAQVARLSGGAAGRHAAWAPHVSKGTEGSYRRSRNDEDTSARVALRRQRPGANRLFGGASRDGV